MLFVFLVWINFIPGTCQGIIHGVKFRDDGVVKGENKTTRECTTVDKIFQFCLNVEIADNPPPSNIGETAGTSVSASIVANLKVSFQGWWVGRSAWRAVAFFFFYYAG